MSQKPDEKIAFANLEVSLYRNAVPLTQMNQNTDRMVVQHFTGEEEDVFIYREPGPRGKRRVGAIKGVMILQGGSSPATPVTTTFGDQFDRITDEEDEQRLLKLYASFAAKK
jgi:hypothetical protein